MPATLTFPDLGRFELVCVEGYDTRRLSNRIIWRVHRELHRTLTEPQQRVMNRRNWAKACRAIKRALKPYIRAGVLVNTWTATYEEVTK